jgi:Fungal trichothecene efflux pump (TRI12)
MPHGVGVSSTCHMLIAELIKPLGFYINLPIGAVVALGLLFIQLPNKHTSRNSSFSALVKSLDFGGIILFVGFMVELFFALQWGGTTYPWASSTVIGLFCGAGATFIVFLVWQIFKADQALIPLSLVKKKTVWASCLVYGLTMAGLFLCTYYLPIYFQSVKGATPMLSGVYLLPLIVSQLSSVLISGWLGECYLHQTTPFNMTSA